MIDLNQTVYGVVLDEEGSADYYETLLEAVYYAGGQPIIEAHTRVIECLCYSFADSRCRLHGG